MTIPEKAEDGEEEEFEENCQPTMVRFDEFLSDGQGHIFITVIVYYVTKPWGNGVKKADIIPSYKNSSKRPFGRPSNQPSKW